MNLKLEEFNGVLIIILIIALASSISLFAKGAHSIDTAYNFKGFNITDTGLNEETFELSAYYRNGINQIIKGITGTLVFSLLIGYLIGGLNGNRTKKRTEPNKKTNRRSKK